MNYLSRFFIITFLTLLIANLPAFAIFDIDASVDNDIRKKYNPEKIENDLLPPLPDNLKNDVPAKSKEDFTKPAKNSGNSTTSTNTGTLKEVPQAKSQGQKITLNKRTKCHVRIVSAISDSTSVGTKVYFKLSKPIKTKYFTLPDNTRFVGVVVDSHMPQITGNGGLLVIKIDNIVVNGRSQEISANITSANYKKVFFNNIKGKRKYWQSLCDSMKPGKRFYDKMWASTKKLAGDSVTVIFSPFTLVTGVVVIGANAIGSPVFAMFSKGGRLFIPAGSQFEINLLEDATIYN